MTERHESSCSVYNMPAYPNGPCDCRMSDHIRVASREIGNPSDHPEVIVCAGPPRCHAESGDCIDAANNGCTDCLHIVVHPDGSETEYRLKAN